MIMMVDRARPARCHKVFEFTFTLRIDMKIVQIYQAQDHDQHDKAGYFFTIQLTSRWANGRTIGGLSAFRNIHSDYD